MAALGRADKQARVNSVEKAWAEYEEHNKRGVLIHRMNLLLEKGLLTVNSTTQPLAHIVAAKLQLLWSPQQIAGWLKHMHLNDELHRVLHEIIYRSLYIQPLVR